MNADGAAPSFAEHVGNLDALIAPWETERMFVAETHSYEIDANWKTITENYHECYHCPSIHPALCDVTPIDSGQNFAHDGLWVGGNMELKDFAQTMSLTGESLGVPIRGLDDVQRREVYYFGLFPNLLLSLHPDYVMTHRVEPLGPGRTAIECQWLFPPEATERADFSPAYASEFWDITNREDWLACESVYRGLQSQGFHQGPFAWSEDEVHIFMAMVAQAYVDGYASKPPQVHEPDAAERLTLAGAATAADPGTAGPLAGRAPARTMRDNLSGGRSTMAEPFDMSLVQRGARNRRTPYYEATQKYGPKGYTVYNHMYFPIRFDSFENEFDSLLNAVTLWDVSVERCLEISGPDGFTFAQLMTPRDLSKCAVGQAKYVLICDGDGGIINDPVLTRMDENTFWFALASSDALLFARGLKNAYPDLDVTIKEADVAPLQVQGPKSKDLMVKLLGESILDLKYYYWTDAKIAGVPVVVTRTGWTSEVGYEVYTTDTSRGNEVYEAIMEAGAEFGIKPTGPSDIRRIEGAIFNWGADMTYQENAFELGLDRLVDLDTVSADACISIAAYQAHQGERRRQAHQRRRRSTATRSRRSTT